jgi:ATP/maltotriose-dependent transcriptional regulator MalT
VALRWGLSGVYRSYKGEQQTVSLCRPIVGDLLSSDLRCQDPEGFLALHRRAATLWSARLNYNQAMYYALEAHDEDLAIRSILEVYTQLLQRRLDTLTYWLCSLSVAGKERSPRLLLIESTVALLQGQHALTSPLLGQASFLIARVSVHTPCAGGSAQAREICLQILQTVSEEGGHLCQSDFGPPDGSSSWGAGECL